MIAVPVTGDPRDAVGNNENCNWRKHALQNRSTRTPGNQGRQVPQPPSFPRRWHANLLAPTLHRQVKDEGIQEHIGNDKSFHQPAHLRLTDGLFAHVATEKRKHWYVKGPGIVWDTNQPWERSTHDVCMNARLVEVADDNQDLKDELGVVKEVHSFYCSGCTWLWMSYEELVPFGRCCTYTQVAAQPVVGEPSRPCPKKASDDSNCHNCAQVERDQTRYHIRAFTI
mmetsp:Transcript_41557/g.75319  ORF Transcript_41557/g.75319 Transcript_41557/m.75319 type:complete len:226 (+) Transcript_41557:659-1336(+)